MIRHAVAEDIPALIELGRRFHAATPYAKVGAAFSEQRLRATLESQVGQPNAFVMVVDRADQVAGVLGAIAVPMYMSDATVVVELYWWVDESARGGTEGMRMKLELERWTSERGHLGPVMSSIQCDDTPAESIYERRGYRNIEKSWMRGL